MLSSVVNALYLLLSVLSSPALSFRYRCEVTAISSLLAAFNSHQVSNQGAWEKIALQVDLHWNLEICSAEKQMDYSTNVSFLKVDPPIMNALVPELHSWSENNLLIFFPWLLLWTSSHENLADMKDWGNGHEETEDAWTP